MLTPAVYDYQYLPEVPVSDKRHIVFQVKAKADAHIALSSVYGDTDRKTYEVCLLVDLVYVVCYCLYNDISVVYTSCIVVDCNRRLEQQEVMYSIWWTGSYRGGGNNFQHPVRA